VVAASSGAFGAAVVASIAWKIFYKNPVAVISAAAVAVFSVPGIIFGQFADVYASAIAASSLQLLVYFLWTRPRGNCRAWLVFAAAAFVAQLFMYTQLWLTLGILLAGCWEFLLGRKWTPAIRSLLPAGLLYGILSGAHLIIMLRVIPWSEAFRSYMAPYYPMFWKGAEAGGDLPDIWGYFLLRIYDLFNYQLSLVFRPEIYRPLKWNWVSLPFLMVLGVGIFCRIKAGWLTNKISLESKSAGMNRGDSFFRSDGIIRLMITTLAASLIANGVFLLPFGGCRQMLFILPLFALFYGWLAYMIINLFKTGKKTGLKSIFSGLLIALPVVPLIISLPAIYENRISGIDLNLISSILDKNPSIPLLASEQNIHILELALNSDPRFDDIHWDGYKYPCDALDADFISEFPTLSFTFKEREGKIHWVKKGYFPAKFNQGIWVDMHISRNSRYEGPRMRAFYPTPEEVIPGNYNILTLKEIPGNAPDALHQSIYWPPNSFYLYLITND
jgi:hypothetical protein